MLIIGVFYVLIPEKIIELVINPHAPNMHKVMLYATAFLVIAPFLQLSDCLRLTGVAALRGLKDTKIPMYISTVAFWLIALPCAYVLGFIFKLGGTGIWIGLTIGLTLGAIAIQWRFAWLVKRVELTQLVTK